MGESFEHLLVNMKPLGTYETDSDGDIYNVTVREWVAHQIRGRGHEDVTRGHLRNVQFGLDTPWVSDVTPGGPQVVALVCEFRDESGGHWTKDGYRRHEEPLEFTSPSQLIVECDAIMGKLRRLGGVGELAYLRALA